jgi:hypothetical protein
MEAGKFSFKFSCQTQKNLVGSSKYAYFSSNLRGNNRTYPSILESADHALLKMVRYVLLQPLKPELDAKTKTCLAEGELSSRQDEQAIRTERHCTALHCTGIVM